MWSAKVLTWSEFKRLLMRWGWGTEYVWLETAAWGEGHVAGGSSRILGPRRPKRARDLRHLRAMMQLPVTQGHAPAGIRHPRAPATRERPPVARCTGLPSTASPLTCAPCQPTAFENLNYHQTNQTGAG